MRRREFLGVMSGAATVWPVEARAQHATQATKIARLGYLASGLGNLGPLEAFRQGLRDLGYVEGSKVVIEYVRVQRTSIRLKP
jgi:putative ABC transport system substrate-binding protein